MKNSFHLFMLAGSFAIIIYVGATNTKRGAIEATGSRLKSVINFQSIKKWTKQLCVIKVRESLSVFACVNRTHAEIWTWAHCLHVTETGQIISSGNFLIQDIFCNDVECCLWIKQNERKDWHTTRVWCVRLAFYSWNFQTRTLSPISAIMYFCVQTWDY